MARAAGQVGPEERIYNIELYEETAHVALTPSPAPHTYASSRELALRLLGVAAPERRVATRAGRADK